MEKSGKTVFGPHRCIFFIVWRMIFEQGQIFKLYPHSNDFCLTIFIFMFCMMFGMMLKAVSCVDLFSRPLCWSIYWRKMWFLCGFEYIAKKSPRGIYRDSDWNLYWQSGKVMDFFLPTPWQRCNSSFGNRYDWGKIYCALKHSQFGFDSLTSIAHRATSGVLLKAGKYSAFPISYKRQPQLARWQCSQCQKDGVWLSFVS